MKNKIFLSVAMGCLVTMIVAGWCQASTGPKASVPETEFRFDTVPDGTIVNHTYVIQNKGDAVLNITKVKTG